MPRDRNIRRGPKARPPEYTAGGLPAFMADLARNTVEPVSGLTLRALNRETRPALVKGAITGPFTLAPDMIGLAAQGASGPSSFAYAGPGTMALQQQMREAGIEPQQLEHPPFSGDPIREAVGLDPGDPLGIFGEMLDPTSAFLKVGKVAMAALKAGKLTEMTAGMTPLAAFFVRQAEKPTIKLADTKIISTRRPTAVGSRELPDEEYLQVDLEAMQADPKMFNKNIQAVTQYPNYRPQAGVTGTNARAEAFIEDITGNLLWLHDAIPAQTAARSAKWYDGTGEIITRLEQAYPGLSHRQYAGVIAALSPQKDWYMNASLAERVISTKLMFGGHKFDDGMALAAERIPMNSAAKAVVRNIIGRRLDDLDNSLEQAWFVRLFDEAHNPREYPIIAPEGHLMGLALKNDGAPKSAAWGNGGSIAKAVDIINGGDIANISRQLGNQHKVRSFNNNIADPNNAFGDVTIDTHAVAAALLRPLSGNSTEVSHALGGGSSSSVLGVNGTYPLYAEAYRRAAAQRGLLPRQMQSITWEGVRGLFPAAQKNPKFLQETDRIWDLYRNKAISIDEAREAIHDISGGINSPTWDIPSVGLHAGQGNALGPGNIPQSGHAAGANPNAGTGTRITPSVQEAGLPGRKAIEIGSLRANVDRDVTTGSTTTFRRGDQGNTQRNVATYELRPDHAERLKTIGADAPPVREMTGMAGARIFHAAIKQAKKTNKYGAQVSLKTQDEYAGMRLFITPDGKAGFALNGDDIVSVFNHGASPYNGISTEMVMLAVERGGRKLDNYDTFLPHIYKRLGFEETERYPWDEAQRAADWDEQVFARFNNGRPDYLYMQYRPTGSLVDRLVEGGKLGAPEEVTQHLPEDMLEGVDLKRFDDRLKATVGNHGIAGPSRPRTGTFAEKSAAVEAENVARRDNQQALSKKLTGTANDMDAEFRKMTGGYHLGVEVQQSPSGGLEFIDDLMNEHIREVGWNLGIDGDKYLTSVARFASDVESAQIARTSGVKRKTLQ